MPEVAHAEDLVKIGPRSTFNIVVEKTIRYARVPGATPNCARWVSICRQLFPSITAVGIVAHRNIAGTSTTSQHNWGNAADIFAPWPVMAQIFEFGHQHMAQLSIRLLIFRDMDWYRAPGAAQGQLQHYGGIYHNHVHADFWPQYPL